jgi:Protein of unknown function (DUF4058)
MSNAFPGMDPYLECSDVWEGFHQRAITYLGEMLTPLVGRNYIVDVETRLYLHELSAEERNYFGKSDVSVTQGVRKHPESAGSTIQAPQQLPFPAVETERYSWLEIRDRDNRRIVTAIEILSPTNKKSPDRDEYLMKRTRYFDGAIHFVEIDLLRSGTRPWPPVIPKCDYYVLLCRARDMKSAGFWPIQLRERLPVIPVPLSAPDADVAIDLQALLSRVHDAADYSNWIYGKSPEPPLSSEDQEWATSLIEKARAGAA